MKLAKATSTVPKNCRKTARQKQFDNKNSLPDFQLAHKIENAMENFRETVSRRSEQTRTTKETAKTMIFNRDETKNSYEIKEIDVRQVLKLKIIPPLRKEFFYQQRCSGDIIECIYEVDRLYNDMWGKTFLLRLSKLSMRKTLQKRN